MIEFFKTIGVGACVGACLLLIVASVMAFVAALVFYIPWLFFLLVGLGFCWIFGYIYRDYKATAISLKNDNRTW